MLITQASQKATEEPRNTRNTRKKGEKDVEAWKKAEN